MLFYYGSPNELIPSGIGDGRRRGGRGRRQKGKRKEVHLSAPQSWNNYWVKKKKKIHIRDFPDGPVVRLHLSMQKVQVWSLIGELRSHMASWPKNQNTKQKQYCNKLNKDFKKLVHIKKLYNQTLIDRSVSMVLSLNFFLSLNPILFFMLLTIKISQPVRDYVPVSTKHNSFFHLIPVAWQLVFPPCFLCMIKWNCQYLSRKVGESWYCLIVGSWPLNHKLLFPKSRK